MKPATLFLSLLLLTSTVAITTAQASGFAAQGHYPYGYYPPGYMPRGLPYGYPPQRPMQRYPAHYSYPAVQPRVIQKPIIAEEKTVKPQTEPAETGAQKKSAKTATTTSKQSVSERKQAFIELLMPHIQAKNASILQQRKWLLEIFSASQNGQTVSKDNVKKLSTIARQYRVDFTAIDDQKFQQALLAKVDIIPASLTLAQAANESAWGQSRFARQANNLFGIWTYDADKGLKPKNREAGKKHFVRKFADVGESVDYYMHMLNSHPAYQQLRVIRQQLRSENRFIEGRLLAQGLKKYSAKGEEYIELIQQLIAQNQWASLDRKKQQA